MTLPPLLFKKGPGLRALKCLVQTYSQAAWQYRFRVPQALALPKSLELTALERARQQHYFYGASYLAALMCSLRNKALSKQEWHFFSNLSTLAAIFDDLVEVYRKTNPSRIGTLLAPEVFAQAADQRGLSLHLLDNICRNLPPRQLTQFQAFLYRVFKVETTLTTTRPGFAEMDVNALEIITAEKGGASILLFRSVLENQLSREEEVALYQVGYLTQFGDDLFDLWQDQHAGIPTLPTILGQQNKLELLKDQFETQLHVTQQAIRQIPYPADQTETALRVLHYLSGLIRFCLQHYQQLHQRMGHLPIQNRTLMVVDMQNRLNQWKLMRQILQPFR